VYCSDPNPNPDSDDDEHVQGLMAALSGADYDVFVFALADDLKYLGYRDARGKQRWCTSAASAGSLLVEGYGLPLTEGYAQDATLAQGHAAAQTTDASTAGARCCRYGVFQGTDSGCLARDTVLAQILSTVRATVFLPPDVSAAAEAVRAADLDVLVFPELGMDPVSYFLSFSRLVPVQVTMLGHADTSGVPSIDYFLTSSVEGYSARAIQERYTETPVLMRGLGTVFLDQLSYSTVSESSRVSPRTLLLERARFVEDLGLPRSAHLFIVAQPLYKLHPSFDAALSKILLRDRLAVLVLVDSVNHTSWQELLATRLAGAYSRSVKERVRFFTPHDESDCLRAIAAAHVVLDPFPASGFLSSLQALAVGVPVVTFPSERMAGRLTLALYDMMDYRELVVTSAAAFSTLALELAHQARLRARVVREILERRPRLFDTRAAVADWKEFIRKATAKASLMGARGSPEGLSSEPGPG
jgi:glycosyltransferase involved in cell wall biosynthesis